MQNLWKEAMDDEVSSLLENKNLIFGIRCLTLYTHLLATPYSYSSQVGYIRPVVSLQATSKAGLVAKKAFTII